MAHQKIVQNANVQPVKPILTQFVTTQLAKQANQILAELQTTAPIAVLLVKPILTQLAVMVFVHHTTLAEQPIALHAHVLLVKPILTMNAMPTQPAEL